MPTDTAPPAASVYPKFLRALESRNYRLFFSGQIISLMGTWMTMTASLWLGYHLEHSAFLLGMVGFASQAPIFFLSPVAGVWVDRVDKRKLLIVTQILSLLQSGVLAVLALTGTINIWLLITLNVVQGTINAFDVTARQAFVVEMIDRRELMGNAIALNSTMFNLARLVGPGVGGLLIAWVGAGYCYLIDALSYIPVIFSLWMIHPNTHAPASNTAVRQKRDAEHPLDALRAGVRYVWGFAPIGNTLLLVAAASFTGFAAPVILPILARDVFGGDARTLGWLMSASGGGGVGRRGVPEHADERARAGHGDRAGRLRDERGANRHRQLPHAGTGGIVHGMPGRGRRAADGVEQHGRAEPGGRRQARPGDESVCDGVYGYDATG